MVAFSGIDFLHGRGAETTRYTTNHLRKLAASKPVKRRIAGGTPLPHQSAETQVRKIVHCA